MSVCLSQNQWWSNTQSYRQFARVQCVLCYKTKRNVSKILRNRMWQRAKSRGDIIRTFQTWFLLNDWLHLSVITLCYSNIGICYINVQQWFYSNMTELLGIVPQCSHDKREQWHSWIRAVSWKIMLSMMKSVLSSLTSCANDGFWKLFWRWMTVYVSGLINGHREGKGRSPTILTSLSNPVDEAHGIKSMLCMHHSHSSVPAFFAVIILVFNPVDPLIFLIIICWVK